MSRKNRPRRNREYRGPSWDEDAEWEIHRATGRQSTRRYQPPPRRERQPTLPSYKQQVNQFLKQHSKKHPEVKAVVTEFMMGKFYMRPEVALRFAEYARAAARRGKEIGGFCRVQRTKNGDFIATDLKIFPQTASAAFFEMDGRIRNQWQTEMKKAGRKDELAEWNCLIHCHPPGTAPFLSGTDLDQIKMFGHRRHFWSIIVESDTHQIMNLNWRVHFYHGGMAPDADGMLAPATPPLLVKDIPVDVLPTDWKEIHDEVEGAFKANSAEFIGESATRSRQPVGFRPSQQHAGPNPGGYLIGGDGQASARQHLDKASSELEAAIADLEPGDVPSASEIEPLTDEDIAALRDAGISPEDVEAAMRAEFYADENEDSEEEQETTLIFEGSVVSVTSEAVEVYAGSEDWQERVRDMVDSEFTVESITTDGKIVVNDGVVLPTDVVELVQQ